MKGTQNICYDPISETVLVHVVTVFFLLFQRYRVRPNHPQLRTNPVTTWDIVSFEDAQHLLHDSRDLQENVQGPHLAGLGLLPINLESTWHRHRDVLGLQESFPQSPRRRSKSPRSLHGEDRSLHEGDQRQKDPHPPCLLNQAMAHRLRWTKNCYK